MKRIRIYLSGVRSEYETVMGELTEKHDAELRRAQDSINDLKQLLHESDTNPWVSSQGTRRGAAAAVRSSHGDQSSSSDSEYNFMSEMIQRGTLERSDVSAGRQFPTECPG